MDSINIPDTLYNITVMLFNEDYKEALNEVQTLEKHIECLIELSKL